MKNIFVFLLAFSVVCFTQNSEELRIKQLLIEKVSIKNLMKTVTFLSSKELQGRASGSQGHLNAINYFLNEFKKYKVSPLPGHKYLQELSIEFNKIKPSAKVVLKNNNGRIKKLKLGSDYVFRGFTGRGKINGKIVFCGYGIRDTINGYNDYENIDVKDKVAMVFKYNPKWKVGENGFENYSIRKKSLIAKTMGAKAIIFISFPNDKNPQLPIGSVLDGDEEHLIDFPQIHIKLEHAKAIANEINLSLNDIQSYIDSLHIPSSFTTLSEIQIEVETEYQRNQKTYNLIGYIPGSHPLLKDEYIIIGAHLDHVGEQANEIYFPGANDNASGSAAVLEIARILSEIKLNRSIIFVLFTGEENGLAGSKFFVRNSPVPIEKITAMLNLDCIGFGDSIQIGNGKSAPVLFNLIKLNDSLLIRKTINSTWNGGGADASPFHENRMPAAYFVTTNSYKHLHLTSDKPETINKLLYHDVVKLCLASSYDLGKGIYRKEEVLP